jgi:hypothetical protein
MIKNEPPPPPPSLVILSSSLKNSPLWPFPSEMSRYLLCASKGIMFVPNVINFDEVFLKLNGTDTNTHKHREHRDLKKKRNFSLKTESWVVKWNICSFYMHIIHGFKALELVRIHCGGQSNKTENCKPRPFSFWRLKIVLLWFIAVPSPSCSGRCCSSKAHVNKRRNLA